MRHKGLLSIAKEKLIFILIAASFCLFYLYSSHTIVPNLLVIIADMQHWNFYSALFWLSILYIVSTLFFIPIGLPLNLLVGFLWGTLWGGLVINILAIVTASIAFIVARKFGGFFLEKYYQKYKTLRDIDSVINQYDWQFIFMARINPIVPFGLSNYLFGLIHGLSYRRYIIATGLANLIPCFAFASIGALLTSFTPQNRNLHHTLIEIGLVLLFISLLFVLKIFFASKGKINSRKQNENDLMCSDVK